MSLRPTVTPSSERVSAAGLTLIAARRTFTSGNPASAAVTPSTVSRPEAAIAS
jgi:hypothetical protein